MYHTRDIEEIADTLVDLIGFFASPKRDDILLREAGVELDRALFPLLVRLERSGPLGVAALAAHVGRDHTTLSRQLAKLETLCLIVRPGVDTDRRLRTAALTPDGLTMVKAIASARQRLLSQVLADWNKADRARLGTLNRRFINALANVGEAQD